MPVMTAIPNPAAAAEATAPTDSTMPTLTPDMTMDELCREVPGARRALFRHFHIGGCSSCGFQTTETVRQVCERNGGLDVEAVIARVLEAHALDEAMMISPSAAARERELHPDGVKLVDIRTREEYEAVHIAGSIFFTQEMMQEAMGQWQRETGLIIFLDHLGDRSLDAAAYFAGHGFQNVRAMRGGIDAWSVLVDPSLPRYHLESVEG